MKNKSPDRGSVSPRAGVERRRVPRVAVARRIDSKRPTRVWSLLLPPSFRPGGASNHERPAIRPDIEEGSEMWERRPETRSGRRALRLAEWMSHMFDVLYPLLAIVMFTVIVIGVLFALTLLGLAIVGAVQASLSIGPMLKLSALGPNRQRRLSAGAGAR